jgi:hypothetical protein
MMNRSFSSSAEPKLSFSSISRSSRLSCIVLLSIKFIVYKLIIEGNEDNSLLEGIEDN